MEHFRVEISEKVPVRAQPKQGDQQSTPGLQAAPNP